MSQYAIYTEKHECQDCYRCVRICPVKAIKVENGHPSVIPDRCVLCGHCVAECPKRAMRVRDDVPKAKALLARSARVYVSLAPSWVADFPGVSAGTLVAAFRRLGFAGVSETALGAEEVSAHAATMLEPGKVSVSRACPAATEVIRRYQPERAHLLTPLLSPLLTHCKLLKRELGEDIRIVFVGPCIAKTLEAESHPELLDVVLTFEDVRRWFDAERIGLAMFRESGEGFIPHPAQEGTLYPVDGGMIAGIRSRCAQNDPGFMAVSGMDHVMRGLGGLEDLLPDSGLFVEVLACAGGCINGPRTTNREGTACKRYHVLKNANYPDLEIPRRPAMNIDDPVEPGPVQRPLPREAEIREVLRSLDKFSADQEPNCGGCGYDSCRELAVALLEGTAERAMCVTHMRRLAQKKANGLLRTIPSAVVMVDPDLRIIECNDQFARMFALPGTSHVEPAPTLEGALLPHVVPFSNLFREVFDSGIDLCDLDLKHGGSVLHGEIFTIEKGEVVGGVFHHITRQLAIQKEHVVNTAREVIQKNLEWIHQASNLLGEHAAESEIMLQSIIESFGSPKSERATTPSPESEPSSDPVIRKDRTRR